MDTAPKTTARKLKPSRSRQRAASRPAETEIFDVRAPDGLLPLPCPACKTMPACSTTKEILGDAIQCTAVFVSCPNADCAVKPRTKTFGLPNWTAMAAAKLEKMALFEWNSLVTPPPTPKLDS